jgi:hypothetical protein
MQNGILELTIASPRTPNGDTNFPMATSKTFITVGRFLSRAEQASTGIPKSKKCGSTTEGNDRGNRNAAR